MNSTKGNSKAVLQYILNSSNQRALLNLRYTILLKKDYLYFKKVSDIIIISIVLKFTNGFFFLSCTAKFRSVFMLPWCISEVQLGVVFQRSLFSLL